MPGNNVVGKEVQVDAQAFEGNSVEQTGDEVAVVDETPVFRPCVEQEIQAKVDSNHPDGIVQDYSHLTLAQEERIKGREQELARISARARMGCQDGRAERTRRVVRERCQRQRVATRRADPRRGLSQDELARVNQAADRLVERLEGPSRAAIARTLARRVRAGQALSEAVFATLDDWKVEAGVPCAIEEVGELPGDEVTIEGRIETLWDPSSVAIEQVGLITDDTDKIKFTSWVKSDPRIVDEGDWVRMVGVKANRYRGRWSVAVTSESRIAFSDRDPWWADA